ncbi:hypothetical protein ACC687_39270, partial [Rhizobium ruizarguesonis]
LSGVNVQTQAAFMTPISGEPATAPTLLLVSYDGQRFSPALAVLSPERTPGPSSARSVTLELGGR